MVSGGDYRDAGTKKVDGDLRRNPPPGSGVFAIHNHEIEGPIPLPLRDARDHGIAAGFADDIPEEKKREHSRMIVLNSKIPS